MNMKRGLPPSVDTLKELAVKGLTINQIVRVYGLSSDKKLRTIAQSDAALYEKFKQNGEVNQSLQRGTKIV